MMALVNLVGRSSIVFCRAIDVVSLDEVFKVHRFARAAGLDRYGSRFSAVERLSSTF
jgi:hypothetical protein